MWSLKYADTFSSLSHDTYHTYNTYHAAFLQDFFEFWALRKLKKKELCLKFLTHKEYKTQK